MRFGFIFLLIAWTSSAYSITYRDSVVLLQKVLSMDSTYRRVPIVRIKKRAELILEARQKEMNENWIQNRLIYFQALDYSRIGDFDRSIEIMLTSVVHYQKLGDFKNLAWAYNDLGVVHANKGELEKSLVFAQKALKIAREHRLEDLMADFQGGVADNLVRLDRTEEALPHIAVVDKLIATRPGLVYDETKGYHYLTKGLYSQKQNEPEEAIAFYKRALRYTDKFSPRKSLDIRNNLAELYLASGNPVLARNTLLASMHNEGADTNILLKEAYFLSMYNLLAKSCFELNKLDSALYYVDRAEAQFVFFQSQYVFDNSKLFHNDLRRNNLALGVQIAYSLYLKTKNYKYLQRALILADQAKSNVLNERLTVNATLNTTVSAETKELRFQWVYELNELENSGDLSGAIVLRNRLDSLDNVLGIRTVYSFDEAAVKLIQRDLREGQLVIEYFIHEESHYIFSITRDDISVTKQAFANNADVLRFYAMLQNPISSIAEYAKLGSTLYGQLLPKNMSANQSITIIPDGVLYYLPFDALPTFSNNNSGWSMLSYLGNSHTISYDFSLQTLAQKSAGKYEVTYTGFAPRFDDNPELTYLTNGLAAVQQGKSALGGSIYDNVNATTSNLRSFGCNTRVLQLYTHAVSSDSSYDASYIYMADKRMYVDEILTLPLQTDLCLLTACEVGLGKEYSGEGVTGVAWAFKAAGAQNVVQSLWRINQESSSFISERLFDYLSDNVSSVEALQKAKQDYLSSEDVSERLKHPYYWAGMSHYGSGSVWQLKKCRTLWYSFLVFVLVATGVFLYKKRTN